MELNGFIFLLLLLLLLLLYINIDLLIYLFIHYVVDIDSLSGLTAIDVDWFAYRYI